MLESLHSSPNFACGKFTFFHTLLSVTLTQGRQKSPSKNQVEYTTKHNHAWFCPVSQQSSINVYFPDSLYVASLSVHVGGSGGVVRKRILRLDVNSAVGSFGAMVRLMSSHHASESSTSNAQYFLSLHCPCW
jgi:hypothetical protein